MTCSLNAEMSEIAETGIEIQEGSGHNRSVMPSDAVGCTRNTVVGGKGDIFLQKGLGLVTAL